MSASRLLTLAAGPASVVLAPDNGGRVASWTVWGMQLLEPRNDGNHPYGWGSYPMVPYAGRIRHGEFAFDGKHYAMPITMAPHSIHGLSADAVWDVLMEGDSWAVLGLRLTDPWPFGGTVTQLVHLRADRLVQQLTVHAADQDMPATLGWHPWFRRRLDRGGDLALEVDMADAAWFVKDSEGIPNGRLRPVPPRPWDDCFAGVGTIALRWPGALRLEVEHDCEAMVLYDPEHAICVEPQSGPPNAFNLRPDECRVPAGSSLERTVTWRWRMASAQH